MVKQDKAAFAEAVAALAVTFGKECDKPMLRGYWMGLEDVPIDNVRLACRRALRECEYMPTVAQLRKMAGAVSDSDRALLAWSQFSQAVSGIGGYKSVDFDDPIINATVRHLGGWVRCCDLTETEFDTWLRKDFLRVYEAFCRTGVSQEAGAALTGIHESENRLLGHSSQALAKMLPGCVPGAAIKIETGLPVHPSYPALRDERRKKSGAGEIPRIEFKRP